MCTNYHEYINLTYSLASGCFCLLIFYSLAHCLKQEALADDPEMRANLNHQSTYACGKKKQGEKKSSTVKSLLKQYTNIQLQKCKS